MLNKITCITVFFTISVQLSSTKFVFQSLDHLKLNNKNEVINSSTKDSKNPNKIEPTGLDKPNGPFVYWPADKSIKSRAGNGENNSLDPDRILYTANSIGNPFTTPEKCVKGTAIDLLYLCDPDNILSQNQQLQLNAKLRQISNTNYHYCPDGHQHGFKVGMLLVNNILVPFPRNFNESAEWLSQEVIDKWGLGNKGCNDGILILYVKNNNGIFVSVKDDDEKILPMDKIVTVEENFIKQLAKPNNDYNALNMLIDDLHTALPQKSKGIPWSIITPVAIVMMYLTAVGVVYKIK